MLWRLFGLRVVRLYRDGRSGTGLQTLVVRGLLNLGKRISSISFASHKQAIDSECPPKPHIHALLLVFGRFYGFSSRHCLQSPGALNPRFGFVDQVEIILE